MSMPEDLARLYADLSDIAEHLGDRPLPEAVHDALDHLILVTRDALMSSLAVPGSGDAGRVQ